MVTRSANLVNSGLTTIRVRRQQEPARGSIGKCQIIVLGLLLGVTWVFHAWIRGGCA